MLEYVLQQRIDRSDPTCGIRRGPSLLAEACTRVTFRLIAEVAHRFVGDYDAGAFGHDVAGAQNAGPPGVVALANGGAARGTSA